MMCKPTMRQIFDYEIGDYPKICVNLLNGVE